MTKWTNREDGPVHDMYEYIVLSVCVHVPLLLLHRVVNMLHPNTIASKTLPIIRTVFDIVRSIPTFLVSDWYRIVGHHSSNTKRTSTVRDDHYMDVHSLFVVIKMAAGYSRDEHPDAGGRQCIPFDSVSGIFFSHQIDELRQARQTHERLSLPVRGTSSSVLHKKAVSEHASEASLYKLAETVFTFLDQVFLLSCWSQCIVDIHVGIKTPEYTPTVVILAHRSCVKILLFFVYTTPTCRGGNGTCSRLNNG